MDTKLSSIKLHNSNYAELPFQLKGSSRQIFSKNNKQYKRMTFFTVLNSMYDRKQIKKIHIKHNINQNAIIHTERL